MKFIVEKEIFEKCPDFEAGLVAVRGIDNLTADRDIEAFLRHASLEAGLLLNLKPVDKDATIASYREVLSALGIDAAEHLPSMEARLRELADGIEKEKEAGETFAPGMMSGLTGAAALSRMDPANDLVRGAELQFRIPVFAFDMGDEKEPLVLRAAAEGDDFSEAGEPVFALGKGIAVRHFFCERGEAAAVTGETRNLLVVIPCFRQSRRRAMSVRNELARRLKDSFGRNAETDWISSLAPDYESAI